MTPATTALQRRPNRAARLLVAAAWLCAAGAWAQSTGAAPKPAQSRAAASQAKPAPARPALSEVKQAQGPIDRKLVQRIFDKICRAGIEHPKIVMRQAILETGWFRSPFLMTRNNLFGFRKVRYLEFNSIEESVRFYRDWQEKNYQNSDQDYLEFLRQTKYGSPDYPVHVARINWDQDCAAQ